MPESPSQRHQNSADPSKTTLILGCGYLGSRVAAAARQAGDQVYATTRHKQRGPDLAELKFRPLVVDWTDRRTMVDFPIFDRILIAVSYDRKSRFNRFESQVGGLGRFLRALDDRQPGHGHLCYISTTGVYHQTDGRWVDETSPTKVVREGGLAHLRAESLLKRRSPCQTTTILRLAGIYGPGRVPRAVDVIAGRPINSPASGFLNLIHVDDATDAIMAVWRRAAEGLSLERTYAVADDQPITRREFYEEIAKQCGAPEPRFVADRAGATSSMRTGSNKRIWNRRMKRDLLPQLRYPTYREGLTDVLREY